MIENQPVDYFDIHEILQSSSASIGVSEAHGMLTGMVCAAGSADPRQWLGELFDDVDPHDTEQANATKQVQLLYEETVAGLNSPELDFGLLLPDDGEPLEDRTQALGDWCHGFISGLGLGGLPDEQHLSTDIRELLLDISQIASVNIGPEDITEEDANAFEEVVEYVRVGALYMFEELQPARATPPQLQ